MKFCGFLRPTEGKEKAERRTRIVLFWNPFLFGYFHHTTQSGAEMGRGEED